MNTRTVLAVALLCQMLALPRGVRGQVYEKVFSFTEARARNQLTAPIQLLQDRRGDFFGIGGGGPNGYGTVFEVSQDGVLSTVIEFTDNGSSNKGAGPSSLIESSDGYLYGTTRAGGSVRSSSFGNEFGYGTIFRVSRSGDLTTLVEFTGDGATNRGSGPSCLTKGVDGNFYGATFSGGANASGTLFRMSPTGTLTTFIDFTYNGAINKGTAPNSLVQGSDGFFYGTTQIGGANDKGTIFRWAPGSPVTTLFEFTGSDGEQPTAALVEVAGGEFYGTTSQGGAHGFGTIFKLTTTPTVSVSTVLDFTGAEGEARGASPDSPLVAGPDGGLYGVTSGGGFAGKGTFFRLSTAGDLTTLVDFQGSGASNGGSGPRSLFLGSDGFFRGVTAAGGTTGAGTIFRVDSQGTLSTAVQFVGGNLFGRQPYGGLVQHPSGDFYGTTRGGGDSGRGTVFKMTAAGEVTTIGHFASTGQLMGRAPTSTMVCTSDGMLYGTTSGDGKTEGTFFAIMPDGTLTTIRERMAGNNGLALDASGAVFGTSSDQASDSFSFPPPTGRVFRVTDFAVYSDLLLFPGDGANTGTIPLAGVTPDANELWGTTSRGGTNDLGTVFSMTTGGPATVTTIANFTGTTGAGLGSSPMARLLKAGSETFYGVTSKGGTNNFGTIFRVQRGASGLTTLINFTGVGNVGSPQTFSNSSVVTINDRAIATPYPSTINVPAGIDAIGRVRVTLNGFEHTYPEDARFVLVSPTGESCLLMAAAGGGTDVSGVTLTFADSASTTVPAPIVGGTYRPTPNGFETTHITTDFMANAGIPPFPPYGTEMSVFLGQAATGTWSLYAVDTASQDTGRLAGGWTLEISPVVPGGTNLGNEPVGGLVQAPDGNFYGTTSKGGSNNLGTIFKLTPDGVLTTVYEFKSYDAKDSGPRGDLMVATDGNIYGTTAGSGGGDGSIFRIVTPGAPSVAALPVADVESTQALIRCALNPRGAITSAVIEYGRTSSANESSKSLATNQTGYSTRQFGVLLTDLDPSTTYYFRIRATNVFGTTVTAPVSQFTTPTAPIVVIAPPSGIGPTSAVFHGNVNPLNSDTTASFEWGTDGNNFPNIVAATPETVTGNTSVPVSAAVAGLPEGGSVFYRLRATNIAGTVVSGVSSFSTVGVTSTGAVQVGVAEATFTASVNTYGRTAAVKFKYWADATPQDVLETATQNIVSTGTPPVVAHVTGLLENVAYSYRVSVELAGTETDGGAVGFTTDTNQPPSVVNDLVFYSGQVVVDPLANDSDPNDGSNVNLLLDPVLVVAPDASRGVASVTSDRRFISYNPQFNVLDDDALTYRVVDPLGASADGQVRLIAFSKRAGLYGGKIVFGGREGQVAVQMGGGGAISTSFMAWPSEGAGERESFVLKGVFDQRGRFTRTLNSPGGAVLTITLALDADAPRMLGTFEERVNGVSTTGEIAFVLTKDAGTGGLAESGLRTGFLSPPSAQASMMADGYLRMTVGKDARRGARFVGRLPDGEPFLTGARAQGRTYSLTRALEQGGVFTGLVRAIDGSAGAGGMMGNLLWQKRASSRARYERGGVSSVLSLSGVAYPALERGALPPLGANVRLILGGVRRGDGSVVSYRDLLMQLVPGSMAAQIVGSDPAQASGEDIPLTKLQLKVDAVYAAFRGRFLHPATGRTVPFDGALRMPFDGEPVQGRGIFRGPSAAGSVRLEAN